MALARHRRRTTFEDIPELYDLARPTYPPALFDDLAALASLRAGSRVVEIGPGTAKASLPLAERGFELVCVELGERLAALAREKLAPFPNAEVVNANFEAWEPPPAPFDAVVAFTAFHWIDPEVRYTKPAAILRPGGALAVVGTRHVLPPGGDPFWVEVQADYDAVLPDRDNRPPRPPDEAGDLTAEMDESGLFHAVEVRRHVWEVTYTADEYAAVLDTYSANRVLDDETRGRLFALIHARISARPEPTVRKAYAATLTLGRTR